MISEFGFLAFILFFVYNLATGTVSIKCFNVLYVLQLLVVYSVNTLCVIVF